MRWAASISGVISGVKDAVVRSTFSQLYRSRLADPSVSCSTNIYSRSVSLKSANQTNWQQIVNIDSEDQRSAFMQQREIHFAEGRVKVNFVL